MPEQVGEVTSGNKSPMTAEDDLRFLRSGDNDETKVVKKEAEEEENQDEETEEDETSVKDEDEDEDSEEEKEDSDDEDDTEESEDEEGTEDEEETVGAIITAKDLKGKYPDIFKKFPELRSVIYREQQYSKVFVDPKEAQEAANNSDSFKEIENDLISGESKPLLEAIKDIKGSKFDKLAAGLLPALKAVDEATYMKVLAVPFKMLLRKALMDGRNKKDKNLELSAQHIHNFIFDNLDFEEKAVFEDALAKDEESSEKKEYRQKLDELDKRDHNAFKVKVDGEWLAGVKESFFDKFDPDGAFTKWAKDKMFEDCINQLNEQFTQDARFQKSLESLWKQAKAAGYNSESKSRIVTAALARARQIIPQVRTKIRTAALAKEGKTDKKKVMKVVKKEGRQPERRTSTKDTSKMSDLDIIRGA